MRGAHPSCLVYWLYFYPVVFCIGIVSGERAICAVLHKSREYSFPFDGEGRDGGSRGSTQPMQQSSGLNYFAASGKAGSFPMSRASCWMISVPFVFAKSFLMRSIDATVCERSKLNHGTPLLS